MRSCLKCAHAFSSGYWICPACGYAPVQLNGFDAHAEEFADCGGGFNSEYFETLDRLEGKNFWFRARNELILWALQAYKPSAQNFLEVGCGTGFVLSGISEKFPHISLSGSEIFLEGLSHAAARIPSARFMQMDARRVPFVDEFDAIGAFDVLEHIEEDEVVLSQLYSALRSDGILLLTVPQHPRLWSAFDEHACHVRRYTCAEIESKVRKAGFQILKSTSFVMTLLPAMIISREIKNNKAFDPVGELKINPFVNGFFYCLMFLEVAGIRIGLSYPFGGSRLVVAKKKCKYLL